MTQLVMSKRDGDILRELRELQNPRLSQRDVARMLDVPEERYRSWEYGRVRLPKSSALVLASAWGIPWTDFYGTNQRREFSPPVVDRSGSLSIGHALLDLILDALENPHTPKEQKADLRATLHQSIR